MEGAARLSLLSTDKRRRFRWEIFLPCARSTSYSSDSDHLETFSLQYRSDRNDLGPPIYARGIRDKAGILTRKTSTS
jgi:hypothetical protein